MRTSTSYNTRLCPHASLISLSSLDISASLTSSWLCCPHTHLWQGNAYLTYLTVSVENNGCNVSSVHAKTALSTCVATHRLPVASHCRALALLIHTPLFYASFMTAFVRIGTRWIWDALVQDRKAGSLRLWVQKSGVLEHGFGVQSSEVARMYARRTETWFLGNLVYDYAAICIVVHSLVAGMDKPYPQDTSYP